MNRKNNIKINTKKEIIFLSAIITRNYANQIESNKNILLFSFVSFAEAKAYSK